jgi:hypothetical protein
MPTLEITRAGFRPEHAMMTRNYLLSIMLWPVECDQRREFMRTCELAVAIDATKAVPGAAGGNAAELAERAFNVRRPVDHQPEIDRRTKIGAQIGEFYATAWVYGEIDRPFSVKAIRGALTTPARRKLHPAVMGDKSLEAALREYRPVATLWAASYIQRAEGIDDEAPCALNRLAEFLALAESVRAIATSLPLLNRSPGVLSRQDDVWRPPPYLHLPKVSLRLP